MQQITISMLKPKIGVADYYDLFYRNYSLMVSTNIVTAHIVDVASEEEIFNLIMMTSEVAETEYSRIENMYPAMGLNVEFPQTLEPRGLNLDDLIKSIEDRHTSAKATLANFINANEFVFLYAIFEDATKTMLIQDRVICPKDNLHGKDVMNKIKERLKNAETFGEFRDYFSARTGINNFADAEKIWKFFMEFRHLYVHSGGRATEKWLEKFKEIQNDLIKRLSKGADLANIFVADIIDGCQPKDGQLFVATDKFTNVFRNFVVAIMEALYLTELSRDSAT